MPSGSLHIRAPWTMPSLDTVDIFIDALHKQIGTKHPLYQREVFPVALRRNPDAVIFETDDEPEIYALVYVSWSNYVIDRKRGVSLKTEILPDRRAIQARMDMENAEWLAQFE